MLGDVLAVDAQRPGAPALGTALAGQVAQVEDGGLFLARGCSQGSLLVLVRKWTVSASGGWMHADTLLWLCSSWQKAGSRRLPRLGRRSTVAPRPDRQGSLPRTWGVPSRAKRSRGSPNRRTAGSARG